VAGGGLDLVGPLPHLGQIVGRGGLGHQVELGRRIDRGGATDHLGFDQ